jgi:hypothetical protein
MMPNGRTGGFLMNVADWKELTKVIPEQTTVGDIVDGGSIREISVADVIRFIEQGTHDRVAVEEQHHDSYILHISNEPESVWVTVGSESAIFPELQRLHARYKIDHPDWNGWIAF